jgi:2-keto-4-pentenoate hydratase/2-oxohepta-3-ene-1,7-dioic acid hydratase in catechol pathway
VRLLTFTVPGEDVPRWGWLDPERPDTVIDATGPGRPAGVTELVTAPAAERLGVLAEIRRSPGPRLPLRDVTVRAPLRPVRNVFAAGANYRAHVAESAHSAAPPDRPIFFTKATTSVTGPGPVHVDPELTRCVDWEVEVGVVLGAGGCRLTPETAMDAVFGYLTANDLSARDQQHGRPEGQWFLGKSLDGFCPLGPWLVLADEVPDPQDLRLRLTVNGTVEQDGSTKEMIFPIGELIAELSRFITLLPGDILLTGTPSGVGDARVPPVYLRNGDEVSAEVAGLGVLTNRIVEVRR